MPPVYKNLDPKTSNESQLTKELLFVVLKMLDAKSLVSSARVNKTWYHLLKQNPLRVIRETALTPLDTFAYTYVCQRLNEAKITVPPQLNSGNSALVARHLHAISTPTLSKFFTTKTQVKAVQMA